MILPYIEQQQLWDEFAKGKQAAAQIEIYVCPSDPPQLEGSPAMSYLANAARSRMKASRTKGISASRRRIPPTASSTTRLAAAPTYATSKPDCHSQELDPVINMTLASVQSQGDEATNTLMFAEGVNARVWTGITQPDKKWHYGFCWEDPQAVANAATSSDSLDLAVDKQYRMMNAIRELLPDYKGDKAPNTGFASSHHPRGVNVAFSDGHVILLSDTISPIVYAHL